MLPEGTPSPEKQSNEHENPEAENASEGSSFQDQSFTESPEPGITGATSDADGYGAAPETASGNQDDAHASPPPLPSTTAHAAPVVEAREVQAQSVPPQVAAQTPPQVPAQGYQQQGNASPLGQQLPPTQPQVPGTLPPGYYQNPVLGQAHGPQPGQPQGYFPGQQPQQPAYPFGYYMPGMPYPPQGYQQPAVPPQMPPHIPHAGYMAQQPQAYQGSTPPPTPAPSPVQPAGVQPNFGNVQSPPNYTGPTGPQYSKKPRSFMVEAIAVSLICCQPLGIAAIVNAANVNARYYNGDLHGARLASEAARRWIIWAIVMAVVVGFAVVALQFMLAMGRF